MKGKIDGLEYWGCKELCGYLEEAGLSQIRGRTHLYKCDECDAGEVISVIEYYQDVMFSNTEYYKLASIMRRGFIEISSFANWLLKCNAKPNRNRKTVTQEMPLFAQRKESEIM